MMDIDFDTMEEIIRAEKEKHSGRKHKSSRSRSRDRSHSRKKHSHSKHRESHSKPSVEDPAQKQQDLLEKQIEEARRQAEEAQRDDCTVLVQRLNIDADERDLYKFIVSGNVGKVRDVQIVRDPRSGRSKGVAYVEFYAAESVLKAMTLTGTKFMGQEVVIQASQAEKNRAAQAAKYKKDAQETEKPSGRSDGPMRIKIEGFKDLAQVFTENDYYKLFSPFGSIEYLDCPKKGENEDPAVYIQYKRNKDAKLAVRKMNGFSYKGRHLHVCVANEGLKPSRSEEHIPSTGIEAEERGKMLEDNQEKMNLMQRLDPTLFSTIHPPVPVSPCLLLSNLFDAAAVDLTQEPNFFEEVQDDVFDKCSELGEVGQVWVDQTKGNVWVKFTNNNIQAASATLAMMNGRLFGGRMITATYVTESAFDSKVGQK